MTDYIKREDAIRALAEYEAYDVTCETGIETTADDCVGTSAMVFEKIPPADVAPVRHGHWVESFKVNAPPTLKSRWVCSWCGNVQTYGATDYCPNCGAKMDEENTDAE